MRPAPPLLYLYVSDRKIDSLLEQMPLEERKSLAIEAQIDLKFLKLKFSREAEQPQVARMARLRAVERYLERGPIGEFGDAASWVRGTRFFTWGLVGSVADTVAFVHVGEECILVAGSAHHVLGLDTTRPTHEAHIPSSLVPHAVLSTLLPSGDPDLLRRSTIGSDERVTNGAMHEIEVLKKSFEMTPVPLQMLAKTMWHATTPGGQRVLLASPLYVALP